MTDDDYDYTKYRSAWIAILRRQTLARALRYAAFAAILASLFGLGPRLSTRLLGFTCALVSLAAHIVIQCPRCRAWWPLGSDDDGQRNPCRTCGLRWGQEDESGHV